MQCAWLCSKVKNNLILLTYILTVCLSYPSSRRESRGLGKQTLIFRFTGKFGFRHPASLNRIHPKIFNFS